MTGQDTESTRSKATKAAIGFPAPLLGKENIRLPVLYNEQNLIALQRPPHVLAGPHPWFPNLPVMALAINEQLQAGKPELLRLGLSAENPVQPIFHMDPGIAGVTLLASGNEATNRARNDFGSSLWTFRFVIVSIGGPNADEAECDLPIARHFNMPTALVSHRTGKKTSTHFHRLERIGKYNIWEATTNYYRADQLPLHALELGIRICGENHYAHEYPIFLSRIKRGWEGDTEKETPLYEAPSVYLAEITFQDGTSIKGEPPTRLANLIKQLRRYKGEGK